MSWPAEMSTTHCVVFLLVLARVAGLVITAPLFSAVAVPLQLRALLAFTLALLVMPTQTGILLPELSLVELCPLLAVDLIIGLVLGLGMAILMAGFQLAGQLIAQSSGLSLAEVLDPGGEGNVPVLSQLLGLFSVAVYLLVGGQRWLVAGLLDTFVPLPPGAGRLPEGLPAVVLTLVNESFSLGVRAAAPVVISVLLATLVLSLVSRTLPQLNVLSVGFGLNTFTALGVLAVTLGTVAWLVEGEMPSTIALLLRTLSHTAAQTS